jgi:hypothetical protein
MSEIIEIMSRADVDYFWQEGGTRFDGFEKPVADGVRRRMEAILAALAASGWDIRKGALDVPGGAAYEARLVEIGRVTTTWAKFEHWIDQAIWLLAGVDPRKGACITTQIGSIHGKFRTLVGLMTEASRPPEAIKEANQLSEDAAKVVQIRTRFAHGPIDVGVNFETREFEVYLRRVALKGRELIFETSPLTHEELEQAQAAINKLYLRLIKSWALLVGTASTDTLAPPHA